MLQVKLPSRKRGAQTKESEDSYLHQVHVLRRWMTEYKADLGFAPSSRGWCYALESEGIITKGEFQKAIRTIASLRKAGYIGFDLVADDSSRQLNGYDIYDRHRSSEEYVNSVMRKSLEDAKVYRPVSYWEHQRFYPIVMVEKIDLVNLFRPVLPYAVKIFNARGWADVNSRVHLVNELKWADDNGLEPVILYCGDHDPAGLQISDTLREQLTEISCTLGYWEIANLRIIRFGLNASQIDEMNISWIDGLETSSGKDLAKASHPDFDKRYVQDYLTLFGPQKVEANALIARSKEGRKLMSNEIWRWLDLDAHQKWEDENREATEAATAKANQIGLWLSCLEAAGWLYEPAKALPAMRAMKLLNPEEGF